MPDPCSQCLNSAGVIGTPLASTPSPTFVPNNPSPSFMRAPPPHLPVRRIPSQRIQNHRIQYDFCVFCKNNGEDETYYLGHTLKDDDGRVCCPVLFAYTCPLCGACGPVAHTIKYCPKNKEHQERDVASINELKGLRASTGRMRQDAVTTTFMNAAEYFDANNAAQRPQQTPAPSTFLPTRPFNGHRSGFACSSATPQRMVRSNHEETMNVDKAFQALFPRRD